MTFKKAILFTALPILMSTAAQADAIDTFRKLCLANAGNTAAILKAGKKSGFKMRDLGNNGAMGMRKKTDESLQLNAFTRHSFECAVTTSDMADPKKVTARFFNALGLKSKRGVARGKIGGRSYTFTHDTKGGEAFVMYAN